MDITSCKVDRMEALVPVDEYIKDCIDVDKFLECCKQCNNYDKVWSCPPFTFDPLEYWKQYKLLHLVGFKIYIPEELRTTAYSKEEKYGFYEMTLWKKKFDSEMLSLESKYNEGKALSGGTCMLCSPEACAKSAGKPCRHPDKMRHSIESLGGDVGKTVNKYFNEQLQWIKDNKLPEYFMLVGGVLEK